MAEDVSVAAQPNTTAQLYASLPVSSKCIRLLRISACEGSQGHDAPLQCHLYVADLDTAPSYTALSYVWGTFSTPPQHVYCDEVAVAVTSNCHSALRHLRDILGTFTIWVDAICINQKDVNDKMRQIGIMNDIYSKAQTTYVWLGAGDAATNRAIGYLGRAGFLDFFYQDGQAMRNKLERPKVWGALLSYYQSRWGFSKSTMPYRTGTSPDIEHCMHLVDISIGSKYFISRSDLRRARLKDDECSDWDLNKLLHCDWIQRIWTFQEILLSANPIILCGHAQLSWSRLGHSLMFLTTFHTFPATLRWANIVLTRELFRAGAENFTGYESNLLQYGDFCIAVQKTYSYWYVFKACFTKLTLCLCIMTWILLFPFSEPWPLKDKITVRVLMLPLSLPVVCAFEIVSRLCPNPSYHITFGTLMLYELRLQRNFSDRMVEALRTRKATEPKDMCWGLLSILKGLRIDAPMANVELQLSKVYRQLTKYLLANGQFSKALSMAAQERCADSPSWVLDYSKNLKDIESGDPYYHNHMLQNRSRIFESQLCYRFHDAAESILAVKGLILGPITEVLYHQGRRSQDQRVQEIRTALYWGHGPPSDAQVGDNLVLLAGIANPLLLRQDGETMKIVTAAEVQIKARHSTRFWINAFQTPIVLSHIWERHESIKKKEWMRAHCREVGMLSSYEPSPMMYLDDILIS